MSRQETGNYQPDHSGATAHGRGTETIRQPPEASPPGRYPAGAILCVDDDDLVIYFSTMPLSSGMDVVFSLLADGTVQTEPLSLAGRSVRRIGQLQTDDLRFIRQRMCWNRLILSSSCWSALDAARIPNPVSLAHQEPHESPLPISQPAAQPEPLSIARPSASPRRGQRVALLRNGRQWECVYWGKNVSGFVVAHMVEKKWTLVQLDFARFDELKILDPEPVESLIQHIARDAWAAGSASGK